MLARFRLDMTEPALQNRLDTILLLLVANFLLLAGIGFRYATEITVGVVILMMLIAYGHFRGGNSSERS